MLCGLWASVMAENTCAGSSTSVKTPECVLHMDSSDDCGLDVSAVESDEAKTVDDFFSTGCGFKLGPNNTACSTVLNKDLAVGTRSDCLQFERHELDLIIMAQLQALRSHPAQVATKCQTISCLHCIFLS